MNIYLLCNSDIVNFVLKTNGGGGGGMGVGVQKTLFCRKYILEVECIGEGVWEWECRRPYFVGNVFWK